MSSEIVALANTPLLLVAALLVGATESTAHGLTCESSPGAAARQTTARRTLAPHQFYPAGPCLCAGASPRLFPIWPGAFTRSKAYRFILRAVRTAVNP